MTQFQNATHKKIVVVNPETGKPEIRFRKKEKIELPLDTRNIGGMTKKMAKGGRAENPISRSTGKGGNYRKTKAGAGMTKKGVALQIGRAHV